ncbi:MAG: DUF4214 domain-containing protein [Lachnospiraceae bacterium]|nr:DUF4214 domain-containing protein [Lachnospiraceae bacterium]
MYLGLSIMLSALMFATSPVDENVCPWDVAAPSVNENVIATRGMESVEDNDVHTRGMEMVGDTALPSKYDSRDTGCITGVKDQSPYGNCWSYTVLSAMESSILKENPDYETDLSEHMLCYYAFDDVDDVNKGIGNDTFTFNGTYSGFLHKGFNSDLAAHVILTGRGLSEEIDYKTEDDNAVSSDEGKKEGTNRNARISEPLSGTRSEAYGSGDYSLKNFFRISKDDVEEVKKCIMEYGSVAYSVNFNSGKYYNKATGGYYNYEKTATNHAITVIGWDDDYPADNFLEKPQKNGAWLVKNSWGTNENYGKEGYLWVSYCDETLSDNFYCFVTDMSGKYKNLYQYDGGYVSVDIVSCGGMANIFRTAPRNGDEYFTAVGFELGNTNVGYSVQIYKDVEEGNPTSGTPMLSSPLSGRTKYAGYYTVDLPEKILLPADTLFSVVVFFDTDSAKPRVESNYDWSAQNMNFTVYAKPGESFLTKSHNTENVSWTDWGKILGNGNLRIKAYTQKEEGLSFSDRLSYIRELTDYAYNREPEYSELDSWEEKLFNEDYTKITCADAFFNTPEFKEKNENADEKAASFKKRLFVRALYEGCFLRTGRDDELDFWERALRSGERNGATAMEFFFESDEFEGLNLTDEEFVKRAYRVIMGRTYDKGGFDYWYKCLQNGVSRKGILAAFATSKEFTNICKVCGINRGSVENHRGRDRNVTLTSFIYQLYKGIMGREPDTEGLDFWCDEILDKRRDLYNVIGEFFKSPEFVNHNYSDEEYVSVLYRLCLRRELDTDGFNFWVNELKSGLRTRDRVLLDFIYAPEFKKKVGDYTPK